MSAPAFERPLFRLLKWGLALQGQGAARRVAMGGSQYDAYASPHDLRSHPASS